MLVKLALALDSSGFKSDLGTPHCVSFANLFDVSVPLSPLYVMKMEIISAPT